LSAGAAGLSLSDAYLEAKRHYETVGEKSESVVQASEVYNQGVGALLPNINGNGKYFWQKNVPTGVGTPLSPPYQPQWGVSLVQPLFQGAAINGLKQADAQIRFSEHDLKNTLVQLYENLSATYYSVLSQERDLENLATELKFYDERIVELKRFLKIGRAQMTDVLSVETSRSQTLAAMKNEKGQLQSTREQFTLYSGLDQNTVLDANIDPLPESVKPLSYYLSRRDQRPDVKRDREGLEVAHQGVWIAKEGHLPTISLTADRYFQRYGIYNQIDWDAGIQITIPIFAGGATQSKVRQAESVREAARLTASQTERTGDQDIRGTYELVASNIDQIEELKNYVRIGKAAFEAEKHDFRLGLVRNIDVLAALTAYIEALRTYDTARYTLRANLAHLNAASAFDFEKEQP
jgi:outer membrane protein